MKKLVKLLVLSVSICGMSGLVAFQSGFFDEISQNTTGTVYNTRLDSPTISTDSSTIHTEGNSDRIMNSSKSAMPFPIDTPSGKVMPSSKSGIVYPKEKPFTFYLADSLDLHLDTNDIHIERDTNQPLRPSMDTYMGSSKSRRVIDPKEFEQEKKDTTSETPTHNTNQKGGGR